MPVIAAGLCCATKLRLAAGRHCQVNGRGEVFFEPDGVIPPLSPGTRRLSPVNEGSVAEKSLVNRIEMASADSEQILDDSVNR
jgi:hypothetical protein